jgi:hypothetical protein
MIPIAVMDAGDVGDRLLAHAGAPAWPVRNPAELSALEQAAAIAGLQVQLVSATAADEPRGSELVVGVGRETAVIARLYAHLTGRQVAYAEDVASGVARDPAVIVVMEHALTVAVLDLLSQRASEGHVIGVITGHDADTLRLQALVRSIAARASTRAPPARVSLFPMLANPPQAEPADGILDPRAPGDIVRAALGRGAGVLTLMSHSDGIDAGLGVLVLCPMDRTPAHPDPRRLPRCQERGTCHRARGIPIDQMIAGPKHVAPEALAARVMLYATCWGVLPSRSFDDNAWSLGRRMLNNPRIGALISSWDAQWYDPADVLAFARQVAAGCKVGLAVNQLLTSASARRTGLRMCLFGDPEIRQAPERVDDADSPVVHEREDRDHARRSAGRTAKFDGEVTAELAFLRHYVSLMAPAVSDRALVDNALTALARYEVAGIRGSLAGAGDAAAERWREPVLDALLWRGPLAVRTWLPLSRGPQISSTTTCAHCQQRVIIREFVLRMPESPMRRVATCTHCGVNADSAAPRSIAISVRDGVVHLTTDVPRGAWAARLAVYIRDENGARIACDWPAAGDGWPARSLAIPDGVPSDTLDIAVYLLHGVSLHIARAPYRSSPNRPRADPAEHGGPPITGLVQLSRRRLAPA